MSLKLSFAADVGHTSRPISELLSADFNVSSQVNSDNQISRPVVVKSNRSVTSSQSTLTKAAYNRFPIAVGGQDSLGRKHELVPFSHFRIDRPCDKQTDRRPRYVLVVRNSL